MEALLVSSAGSLRCSRLEQEGSEWFDYIKDVVCATSGPHVGVQAMPQHQVYTCLLCSTDHGTGESFYRLLYSKFFQLRVVFQDSAFLQISSQVTNFSQNILYSLGFTTRNIFRPFPKKKIMFSVSRDWTDYKRQRVKSAIQSVETVK